MREMDSDAVRWSIVRDVIRAITALSTLAVIDIVMRHRVRRVSEAIVEHLCR